MIYKFEDINIGDLVYFNSSKLQSNYDLFWKVLEKLEYSKELVVQLDEMGFKDIKWIIKIEEIQHHLVLDGK
jgi:hypothetical protein